MPYSWQNFATTGPGGALGAPTVGEEAHLTLWPHQSLTRSGFVVFIGVTTGLLAVPILSLLGSPAVWVLLGFFALVVGALWWAIMANVAARHGREELTLSETSVHISHIPARGPALEWEANPHWVTVHLRDDGPVEKYLTLRGNGREVELGAFLSPDEREGLFEDLSRLLR
ncbi:MAG: DUF2244 domain-containing protein [Pseudomonadota bacterium]